MSRIDDVSAHSLGERREHYRKSYGAYAMPINHPDRLSITRMADDMARDEMIDEIHTMLRHLCFMAR